MQSNIVIKPGLRVDPTKKSGPGSRWLTQVNSKKLKKIFEILIFHMKKLKNNSCGYRLKDFLFHI